MDDKIYTCNLSKKDITALFNLLNEKYEDLRNKKDKNEEEFKNLEDLFIKFIKYESMTK